MIIIKPLGKNRVIDKNRGKEGILYRSKSKHFLKLNHQVSLRTNSVTRRSKISVIPLKCKIRNL